jgi:hypothetical protein
MCCGNQRMQLRTTSPHRTAPRLGQTMGQQAAPPRVSFEYAGNTGMTVVGPATGMQYRFDRPGTRVEVDQRDRALLASIRQLRQVRQP